MSPAGIEGHGVVAAGHDDPVAQRFPQMVEGVPERPPRGELVHVGPEHRGQAVASVVSGAGADREIGQEREPFRLRG